MWFSDTQISKIKFPIHVFQLAPSFSHLPTFKSTIDWEKNNAFCNGPPLYIHPSRSECFNKIFQADFWRISSLSIRYNSTREANTGIRLDNLDSSSPLSDGVGFDFLVNELDIVQTWNCLSYGKMSIVRSRVYPWIRSLKQSHSVPPCFIV